MELNLDTIRQVEVSVGDALIVANILPVERVAEISKKNTRTRFKNHVRVEELDEARFSADFWDETIDSWSGFTTNGVEIPCVRANKAKVMSMYPEIAGRVREAIAEVQEALVEGEEALTKN